MAITIVGLGPGNPGHLTREAWDLLTSADEVYVRTARHPTVAALPAHLAVHSFDHLYEKADDFPALYEAIAAQVVELGSRPQGVVYAVPGHPLVGETSVLHILKRAREADLPVRLVDGMSFVEAALDLLEQDGLSGLQLADATELAAARYPLLDPDRPALIGQLYGQQVASDVKLTLMGAYPDDHPVTLIRAAGMPEASVSTLPLHELDRDQALDHLTALYVPPLASVGGLPALQQTVARLRAPDGCPWDREQTHLTLRPHLLEETYEVLAALDTGDTEKLCEELGDLLMQIAMHVQMAAEEGAFRFADVIGRIDSKLKRRHPHVFGSVRVADSAEVLRNWEAIKADERGELAAFADEDTGGSSLSGVPATLPALARAQELGDRAARAGFDWPDVEGVLDKLSEEVGELRAARSADLCPPDEAQARELGDLLFTLVNLARWLHLDAESSLRAACDRFSRRYAAMERAAAGRGTRLAGLSLKEQNGLWEDAKGLDRPKGSEGP